jgi:hypothetical protein
MLEPRVVALAPTPSAWDLDLSYQSADSTNLGAPRQLETTSTLSNEKDNVQSLAMEDQGRSYSEEGINNEEADHTPIEDEFSALATSLAMEDQGRSYSEKGINNEEADHTPIEDEFSALATTLRSLGRDRTQKLVGLQMILGGTANLNLSRLLRSMLEPPRPTARRSRLDLSFRIPLLLSPSRYSTGTSRLS